MAVGKLKSIEPPGNKIDSGQIENEYTQA